MWNTYIFLYLCNVIKKQRDMETLEQEKQLKAKLEELSQLYLNAASLEEAEYYLLEIDKLMEP